MGLGVFCRYNGSMGRGQATAEGKFVQLFGRHRGAGQMRNMNPARLRQAKATIRGGDTASVWPLILRAQGDAGAEDLLDEVVREEMARAQETFIAEARAAFDNGDVSAVRMGPDGMPYPPFGESADEGVWHKATLTQGVRAALVASAERDKGWHMAQAASWSLVRAAADEAVAMHIQKGGASHLQRILGRDAYSRLRKEVSSATGIHLKSSALAPLLMQAINQNVVEEFLAFEQSRVHDQALRDSWPRVNRLSLAVGEEACKLYRQS